MSARDRTPRARAETAFWWLAAWLFAFLAVVAVIGAVNGDTFPWYVDLVVAATDGGLARYAFLRAREGASPVEEVL